MLINRDNLCSTQFIPVKPAQHSDDISKSNETYTFLIGATMQLQQSFHCRSDVKANTKSDGPLVPTRHIIDSLSTVCFVGRRSKTAVCEAGLQPLAPFACWLLVGSGHRVLVPVLSEHTSIRFSATHLHSA